MNFIPVISHFGDLNDGDGDFHNEGISHILTF